MRLSRYRSDINSLFYCDTPPYCRGDGRAMYHLHVAAGAMCGIAAIIQASHLPDLPNWLFHRDSCSPHLGSVRGTTVGENNVSLDSILPSLGGFVEILSRRGPDACNTVSIAISRGGSNVDHLTLIAATLSLRSSVIPPHPRPLPNDPASLLLFNGELYDVDNSASATDSDAAHMAAVLSPLAECGSSLTAEAVLKTLDGLRGPYAFVLWCPASRRIYFARDFFGRRSLLLAVGVSADSGEPAFAISSSVPRTYNGPSIELPPIGLCYLELSSGVDGPPQFGYYARESRVIVPRRLISKASLASPPCNHLDVETSFLPPEFLRSSAVEVSFDAPSPDSCVDVFLSAFRRSVLRRLVTARHAVAAGEPEYAVLFSGGLDSLFLSAILDSVMPAGQPLDLITVAFGTHPSDIAAAPDRLSALQGYAELCTLASLRAAEADRPQRAIRLICVDVGPKDADDVLEKSVRHLLRPCNQRMDASIGTALWLAARGHGYVYSSAKNDCRDGMSARTMVTSPAKILFSGLGADEFMGGYGRHRTQYQRGGIAAIAAEIDADVSRLWHRNLGRDDRLFADHGREVRHPFLDEDLACLVTSMPLIASVCDLSLPLGIGDKALLRRAAERLGLPESATRRHKRAIQFGSRAKQVLERRRT
jgi:asparagine synthetase B (glutamine-hydrolysing)